jgi:hypothetical protein
MQNTSTTQNQIQPTPTSQPTNPTPATSSSPEQTFKTKKPWLLISLVVLLSSSTGV